jgi:hypothetical protein
VRFCQPTEVKEVRYWFDILGNSHVAFAVCSANGRVLAAVDVDGDKSTSRRAMKIKQAVLTACRVRYLRSRPDRLPTVAELQLLVPQQQSTPRGPLPAASQSQATSSQPSSDHEVARHSLVSAVANRRAQRSALWQDSTFQDSFFALDSSLMKSLGSVDVRSESGDRRPSSHVHMHPARQPRPPES